MQKIIGFVLGVLLSVSVFGQEIEQPNGIYNFVPNGGQWPEGVLYKADVNAGKIWLEEKGILYQFSDNSNSHHGDLSHIHESEPELKQHLVFAEFVGANVLFETKKNNPTTEYYNYFLGNDKSKWASELYGYNKIEYINLYANINLIFFEKEQDLKYEYHVKPGGNYKNIRVKYKGHSKIKKLKNGSVVIYNPIGQLIEQKPYVYQIRNGKIVEVESEYVLSNDSDLSFKLGKYDNSIDLIIDPVLVFATYNGAITDNFGMTATYAYDGKAYTGGTLFGNNYPTPSPAYNTTTSFNGASSAEYGITDVFITKYTADGTTMLWTTFIGGGDNFQGTETVHSLICDTLNNIYLYGATSSLDFPMQNAFQNSHSGGVSGSNFTQNGVFYGAEGTDIYVSKLSENGMTLIGSTYIGGSNNDGVNYNLTSGTYPNINSYDSLTNFYGDQFRGEIMLDSLNNILIGSSSRSSDFPFLNGFESTIGGQQDGVLFKLSADFSNLLWSSYFGGSNNDAIYSVKIDSSYNILIAGGTSSNDIPGTVGGLNPNYLGGQADGFVAKISTDGSNLIQSTYFGTSTYDQAIFVEIDRWDNVYLVGVSDGDVPVINSAYSIPDGKQFIVKLSPDLTSVQFSTVFGSGGNEPDISPSAFLVDVCGNIYVSGWGGMILPGGVPTQGMPISTDAYQSSHEDGYNFYLIVIERNAESLIYGSYMGGGSSKEHVDGGTSRFDKFGVVYQSVCGGCWANSDFPVTPDAYSLVNGTGGITNAGCNNLVFKFDFELVPHADFTVNNLEGCAPLTLTFDNESNDTINSIWNFPSVAGVTQISGGVNPVVEFSIPGTYEVFLNITDTICNLQDTAKKVITVYPALELEVSNDTVLCNNANTPFDIIANANGSATSFTWATDINFTDIINTGALDSIITVNPNVTTTYYVTATNGWPLCDLMDSVQVLFLDDAITLMGDTTICRGDTLNLFADYSLGGVTNFDWSPNTYIYQENQNVAFATPVNSQYYYLTATINGCPFYDSVFVTVEYLDPTTVYATADPEGVPEGGTTTLMGFPDSSIYNYSWFLPNSVTNSTSQTTTATINEDTDFVVLVNKGVCTVPAFVSVKKLEFVCGDVYIFVPNAFTPNGDSKNDKVFVRGQNIEALKFMIFDRWGEVVFETNDQSIGWDGTFKNEKLDPDVYVYHLKVICFDGQENLIKGNITLLR